MTVQTLNEYKVILSDENKILTLPDGVICTVCYTPLTFDESEIVESDRVIEEIESTL